MYQTTITLTFGECAENYTGMQKIGTKSDCGFSLEDLQKMMLLNPEKSELYNLKDALPATFTQISDAYLLIIRNPFNNVADNLYQVLSNNESLDEQKNISGVNWDRHKFMYGKVVNSIARYNLCFADLGEYYKIDPDYENKRGTIYNFKKIPYLEWLVNLFNINLPGPFYVEGNYYYDINKCSIKMHRDNERRKTIGYRLGSSFPLSFKWFHGTQEITDKVTFTLNHGDMYFMTSITSGSDKDKTGLYLKHAAGFNV